MSTLLIKPLSPLNLLLLSVLLLSACSEQQAKIKQAPLPAVEQHATIPDFAIHPVVADKKKAFFDFLRPLVIYENTLVLNDRYFVEYSQQKLSNKPALSNKERTRLDKIAKRYKVKKDFNSADYWRQLLLRVDVIPSSLALSQAALESGWGSSRFAKEGNNIFGQWCFKAGCGLVPANRVEGKHHEVAAFATVNLSVQKYLLNLNRLGSYKTLRAIRAELRQNKQAITGIALAQGLGKYSELGDEYIKHITGMITANGLEADDLHPIFLPQP